MRIFLLGPGYYEGENEQEALHDRVRIKDLLAPHDVDIMELAEAPDDPVDLNEKFATLVTDADEIVVWLPAKGRLATVFGELLLMRGSEAWHGRPIWIFCEEGVLDCTSAEFRSIHPSGQMAYLLDLPEKFLVHTFEYDAWVDLERLVRMYAAGELGDA